MRCESHSIKVFIGDESVKSHSIKVVKIVILSEAKDLRLFTAFRVTSYGRFPHNLVSPYLLNQKQIVTVLLYDTIAINYNY